MAENDKNQGGPLNLSGLVVALSIVAAAFLIRRDAPLDVARPLVSGEELYHGYTEKSVEARLWQDPFAAVARSVNNGDDECQNNDTVRKPKTGGASTVQWTHDKKSKKETGLLKDQGKEPFRVLIATTSGAPYATNAEFRRRLRYAVLAGLDVENYKPADYDHIDYFSIGCKFNSESGTTPSHALRVPYEWFEPADNENNTKITDQNNKSQNNENKEKRKIRVLLLWLDEDYLLADRPNALDRLIGIIDGLSELTDSGCICDGEGLEWPVAIIGPETTDLRDVILNKNINGLKVKFYSYGATSFSINLNPSIPLKATIPDDRKLADILHKELEGRGIDPKSGKGSIAFISEWDTEYGRQIVCTMRNAFESAPKDVSCNKIINENKVDEKYIEKFYSRGLDGAISPEKKKKPQNREAVDKGSKFAGGDKQKDAENAVSETPFGASQYDYMRRLAQELKQKDQELRRHDPDNRGIRAIGVFGNDVYDKLVVLRALKADFPEAVFFTTDYDASLQMKDQTPYTRNLLVASGYGPELAPTYQKEIPPFRSTYQTSAFYATRLAIDPNKEAEQLDNPVIFEIDRNGELVQLGKNETNASSGSKETNIRPEIPPLYPEFSDNIMIFNAIMLFIICISLLVAGWYLESNELVLFGFILFGFSLICFYWSGFAGWLVDDGIGEPLVFSGGVSIWPTILCRLAAILLSIRLMFLAHSRLNQNMVDVEKELGLVQIAEHDSQPKRNKEIPSVNYLRNIAAFFDKSKLNFFDKDDSKSTLYLLKNALSQYTFFESYDSKGKRVIILSVVSTIIFCWALYTYGIGEPSLRNYAVNHVIFQVSLWAEVFFVSALCIYVVDSVILCLAFIEDIAKKDTVWPEDSTNAVMTEIGFRQTPREKDVQISQAVVDLLFIQSRTECVLPLVYSPFFVIALTIFSRSNAFDAFPTCWVAILGDVFAVALIFLCAHAMNRQAMIVREDTLERLENGILRAKSREMRQSKNLSSLASSEQLEKLRDWVINLHQGAFSAPLQQPLFRGLIMPFAGLGLNLMADYGWLPIL